MKKTNPLCFEPLEQSFSFTLVDVDRFDARSELPFVRLADSSDFDAIGSLANADFPGPEPFVYMYGSDVIFQWDTTNTTLGGRYAGAIAIHDILDDADDPIEGPTTYFYFTVGMLHSLLESLIFFQKLLKNAS